jgi:hypothetical protein
VLPLPHPSQFYAAEGEEFTSEKWDGSRVIEGISEKIFYLWRHLDHHIFFLGSKMSYFHSDGI